MPVNSNTRPIVLSCAVIFLYGTIASLLGTLLPSFSVRFHLSPEQNGYIASLQAVGLMLATLIAGPLMDVKGIKSALLGGLILMFVSLIGLLGAAGWRTLIFAIVVLGVGSGTIVAASNNLASQVDERKRASMLNLANLFFGLGGLATPFIVANVLPGNPMRLAYLVASVTAGVLILAIMTPIPRNAAGTGFRLSDVVKIERKSLLFLLCAVVFLYVGCEVGFWNWLPKYLVNRGNDSRTALNILGFGFACGIIVGRLLAIQILRRISAVTVCIAASGAMILTTYATIHLSHPVLAAVAVFCSGVAMGPVFPSALGITSDAFPRMTGTCIGLVITAGWLGTAVSSWIIGRVAGHDPDRLPLALMVIPLFSLLIVFSSLGVKRMLPTVKAVVTAC
jgi:fucose permease